MFIERLFLELLVERVYKNVELYRALNRFSMRTAEMFLVCPTGAEFSRESLIKLLLCHLKLLNLCHPEFLFCHPERSRIAVFRQFRAVEGPWCFLYGDSSELP
jgi:hypothetical protein